MKLAVVGAGIIGVTTAYELAMDGHEVTVFERHLAAAEGGSFANAGVIAPGYVTPWAAPGMAVKVLAQMLSRHASFRFSWPLRMGELAWLWKSFRACRAETYAQNRRRMQALATYSRDRLHTVLASCKLEIDGGRGYTVLLRSERDRLAIEPSLQVLRDNGIKHQELSAEAARQIEPALNPLTPLAQAIHLPDDEVGNCRQFAQLLKTQAQHLGVRFVFGTSVQSIAANSSLGLKLSGDSNLHPFDGVVICAGAESAHLLRPLGLKLPLASVYGYSISAALRETHLAPVGAVMDERYKVAISRLGNRIRVAGGAQLGGNPEIHRQDAIATLYKVLDDWFPAASSQRQSVQVWKGARPMLPDGPPVLGTSGIPGVWLNLGHGSSGWALSCGSARLTADLISSKKPQMDLEGLGIERFNI